MAYTRSETALLSPPSLPPHSFLSLSSSLFPLTLLLTLLPSLLLILLLILLIELILMLVLVSDCFNNPRRPLLINQSGVRWAGVGVSEYS